MDHQPLSAVPVRKSWWRLPLLLGLVLAAIVLSRTHAPHQAPADKNAKMPATIPAGDPRPKVSLTIDFGGGSRTSFAAIAWREGMTVADLMSAWPNIAVKRQGTGEKALVTSINDVESQGADGKNWLYRVNDQMADRSFAVYQLEPGDRVLWTFGSRQ